MNMENGPHLSIELIWEDTDLEELLISASNGKYCGTAKVYFGQGEIAALADTIRGFPKTVSQEAVFEGGSDDGSRARLKFHCIDQLGHAVVTTTLADFAYLNAQPPVLNHVNLELRVDASAIDEFCKQLEAIGRRMRKRAVLGGLAG